MASAKVRARATLPRRWAGMACGPEIVSRMMGWGAGRGGIVEAAVVFQEGGGGMERWIVVPAVARCEGGVGGRLGEERMGKK